MKSMSGGAEIVEETLTVEEKINVLLDRTEVKEGGGDGGGGGEGGGGGDAVTFAPAPADATMSGGGGGATVLDTRVLKDAFAAVRAEVADVKSTVVAVKKDVAEIREMIQALVRVGR